MMTSELLVIFGAILVSAQAADLRIGYRLPNLLSGRIVGGEEAAKGEFPHQVSLQWGIPPIIAYQHFCGGSIINSSWIVTAGHCVRAIPPYGSFVVKAGKHNIELKEAGEQVAKVEKKIVHENYKGDVGPYDIALLKLKTPLTLSPTVGLINLPNNGTEPTGNSTLSGWGSISPNGQEIPAELQKAVLPIIALGSCNATLMELIGPTPLDSTNICTGSMDGGLSACSGDSGGPLIWKSKSGDVQLIGVVSWGVLPCGAGGAPTVYVNVARFVDWIKMNTNKT